MWAYIPTSKTMQPHVQPRCASFYHLKALSGHDMRIYKAVQMTQNWVNVLIVGRLIINPFHILKIKSNHIGFNVGL